MKGKKIVVKGIGLLTALSLFISALPVSLLRVDVSAQENVECVEINVSDEQISLSENTVVEDVCLSEKEETIDEFNEEYLKTKDIMAFDWKNATDEAINHVMGITDWYEIGMWLSVMSEDDRKELLSRDTCLVYETTVCPDSIANADGSVIPGKEITCLFYEYALQYFNENKDTYKATYFAETSTYWDIMFTKDGKSSATYALRVKITGIDEDSNINKTQKVTVSHTFMGDKWLSVTCGTTDSVSLYSVQTTEKYTNAIIYVDFVKPLGYTASTAYDPVPDSGLYKLYWYPTEYGKTLDDFRDSSAKKFMETSSRVAFPSNNYGGKNSSTYTGKVKLASLVNLITAAGVNTHDGTSGSESYPAGSSAFRQIIVFSPISYNVRFDPKGGMGVEGTASCTYGETYDTPAAPTKVFYVDLDTKDGELTSLYEHEAVSVFKGWGLNQATTVDYAAGAKFSNLTATSGGTVTMNAVWAPGSVTLPSVAREGYSFGGWQIGATTYVAGQKYTPTANVVATAKWTANTYKITFNSNGGSNCDTISAIYDKDAALPVPTRVGYTFNGWKYGNVLYNGSVKNLTATAGATVPMVAQWAANTDTPYTVNYFKQVEEDSDEYVLFDASEGDAVDGENIRYGTTDTEITIVPPEVEEYYTPESQTVTIFGDGSTVVNFYYKLIPKPKEVTYFVKHYIQTEPDGKYVLDNTEEKIQFENTVEVPQLSQTAIDKVSAVRGCHCVLPELQEITVERDLVVEYYYSCEHNRVNYSVEHYIQLSPDAEYKLDAVETFEENEFALVTPCVSQNSIDKVNAVRGCHCEVPKTQEKEAEDGLVFRYYYGCAHNEVTYKVEHYVQYAPGEDYKLYATEELTANEYELVTPLVSADAMDEINSQKGYYCRVPEKKEIYAKDGVVVKYYYDCISIEKLVLDMKDFLSAQELSQIIKDIASGKDFEISYNGTVYEFTPEENGELSIKDVSGQQEQVVIPETIIIDGKEYPITIIKEKTFENNTVIKEVVIGSNVKEIKEGAFSGCTNLETAVLPDSITNIDARSFYNCTSLKEVTMPEKLTNVGDSAFENCTSLQKAELNKALTKIGNKAFYNCKSLTSMKIPASVKTIGSYAFGKCIKLKTVSFASGSKLSSIGKGIFSNCKVLSKMKLPSKIKKVPDQAFSNCAKMTQVTLGKNVQSIGKATFKNCKKLKKITIPTKVKTIGNSAFENCSKISSVKIPKNVTKIGAKAFYNCKSLKKVIIQSKKMKSVGKNAFKKCKKGIKITYPKAKAAFYKKNLKGKY